jgi:glycosyltransferase involved in cell wall biosynthesis
VKRVNHLKLAFVVPAFLPARGFGGPLYHVLALARVFQKKGDSIVVYTSNMINPYDFSERLPKEEFINGIHVKRYPLVGRIGGYWITPSMLRDLKRDEYDILHAHTARSFQCDLSAFVSKLRCSPFLITAHGSLGSFLKVELGLRNHILHVAHNLIAKRVFQAADKVIALNRFEMQHFLRIGVDHKKIAIIPNGICLDEFKNRYYDFKEKYGIKGKLVLFVGRLTRIKGLDTLIQAYHFVKRQNSYDSKLVIIGEDWGFKNGVLELIKRYDMSADILLLDSPARVDILSAYHASDIVVLPSNYETFSITILEAFACGKPVIATNVGGIPEMVIDGTNGILVRPNNPKQLYRAIMHLLRNEEIAKNMGFAGQRLVASCFSIDIVARKIENLYKDLCSRKGLA